MKTIRKLKWMLMLTFLAGAGVANAADYSYTHSSGTKTITLTSETGGRFRVDNGSTIYTRVENITVNGGNLTVRFNTSSIVEITGKIRVNSGTLTLEEGPSYTNTGSTLKRASGNTGELILVQNNGTNVNNCRLIIKNRTGYWFILQGNGVFSTTGSDETSYTATFTGVQKAQQPLLLLNGGTVDLTGAYMHVNWNERTQGGAIRVGTVNSESKLTMQDCVVANCYSYASGGAIMYSCSKIGNKISSIQMTRCNIFGCFSNSEQVDSGSTFRTVGNSYCTMEMVDCIVHDNKSIGGAGGVQFNAADVEGIKLNGCACCP